MKGTNPPNPGTVFMDWRGLGLPCPFVGGIGLEGIDNKNKAYYNLRKRLGKDIARLIMKYWNHYHLSPPSSADEALFFFMGVE